ncbi:MAG: hypothetical protein JWO18_1280 [Microbacteriaceae bacterium]|nr:hypothetical protein [Microbacteriaceae bacterium]
MGSFLRENRDESDGRVEVSGKTGFCPGESRFHSSGRNIQDGCRLFLGHPLQHAQSDNLLIGEMKAPERCLCFPFVEIVSVICGQRGRGQTSQEPVVTACTAGEVVGRVRCGDQQPGQHRSVDEMNRSSLSPRFEKDDRDHILGI